MKTFMTSLGVEHPHTLVSMNNLASLLQSQGKYDKAERLYRQTLLLEEKPSARSTLLR